MSDPADAMIPTAEALAKAVASYDRDAVASLLTPLDTRDLHTLAIVLADLAGPHLPPPELDLDVPADLMEQAIAISARLFAADPTTVRYGYRTQPALDARHVAIHAAHLCGVPYAAIGRALGQDHTTAMHAVGRVGESARLRRAALRVAAECGWDRNAQEEAS